MRRTGSYLSSTTLGEAVRAFVPRALPPASPPLAIGALLDTHQQALLALARLEGVAGLVPSVEWLLYSAVRKEALLTSQIEGIQATLTDVFDDEAGIAVSNGDDVEEVTNYLRALRYVQEQLRSAKGLPVSVRLLNEAHRRLMDGVRGAGKQPGELRRSQNWIGGTRPGNAAFVPPPPDKVPGLLADLERFIHQPATPDLPPLVCIALVHAQFETIHPYLDGNGRIGRLLIAVLLEHWQLLPEPLMYLSGYLKQHQAEYYRRLSAIRTEGDWEGWVAFFLEGVAVAAGEAERGIIAIATLIAADRRRLLDSDATRVSYRLFEQLPLMPRFTIEQVRQRLGTTFPTATAAVQRLADLGIVAEFSGQKKNRTFSYKAYIDLLTR